MVLYNFMYFGPQREKDILSGHVKISIVGNECAVLGLTDYGGLTYLGNELVLPTITESMKRQINDYILKFSESEIKKDTEKIDGVEYFQLSENRISANIGFGDKVIDTRDNEIFTVNGNHDASYINKNQHYQLFDRRDLWSTPKTKKEFIERMQKANPFKDWKQVETVPTKKQYKDIYKTSYYMLNGVTIECYWSCDANIYWICIQNLVYQKSTSNSALFYDTIDMLTFEVSHENSIYDVKKIDCSSFWPNGQKEYQFELFSDEVSYQYNNLIIKHFGEG